MSRKWCYETKKLLFIEIELGKKVKKISKEFPQVGFEPSTSRLVAYSLYQLGHEGISY